MEDMQISRIQVLDHSRVWIEKAKHCPCVSMAKAKMHRPRTCQHL